MAAKSKRTLLKPAIIVLVGLVVVVGLFMWAGSPHSTKTSVTPQPSVSPLHTSTTPSPVGQSSDLPHPAGGAASEGQAAQATPAPGDPIESTTDGHEGGQYALKSASSDTTTCTWSAGASCYITFTSQDGQTIKQLPVKVISSAGLASWIWTPGSIGLSTGVWTVQAIGTSNGKQVPSNTEVIYVGS